MINQPTQIHPGDWNASDLPRHFVQFYDSAEFLLETLTQFVRTTLWQGEAAIVVATPEHLSELHRQLRHQGVDLDAATSQGQYRAFDAETVMSRFMIDGKPNAQRFTDVFGPILETAANRYPGVRVYGEMVALSAAAKQEDATVEIERLWNELQRQHAFSLCCAYPIQSFGTERSADLLEEICEHHAAVFPAESYTNLSTPTERSRAVALLQHKAQRLEAEVEQRRHAEEQLHAALEAERAAREQAEHALRKRDEFVSIAAHELKTPLTSLMGQSQLIRRLVDAGQNVDPARISSAFESVTTQTYKLTRLVTQLLDVSRFESGKMPLEIERVDVGSLVNEAVTTAAPVSAQHAIQVSAPDPVVADVDPLRLEQVIVNLLDNAIKYSPGGETIDVALTPMDGAFQLSVRDHGLGIPSERRSEIFERYFQAHDHELRSGMGLGLYISRQIVELHGGRIWTEHPQDGGTRVVLQLPSTANPASSASS